MTNAHIFFDGSEVDTKVQNHITQVCPHLSISSSSINLDFLAIINSYDPQLFFIQIKEQPTCYAKVLQDSQLKGLETILIASQREYIYEAIKHKISGYLLKPLDSVALKSTVDFALSRIKSDVTEKSKELYIPELIGVPTMDGYEFISVDEIIRCESYLKCTRVICQNRSSIVSAYNIGEFEKILCNYYFCRPHQSHLVNMKKIRTYLKEGTMIMSDESIVPVARRHRGSIMKYILHI